jgi:hypothetical protein
MGGIVADVGQFEATATRMRGAVQASHGGMTAVNVGRRTDEP